MELHTEKTKNWRSLTVHQVSQVSSGFSGFSGFSPHRTCWSKKQASISEKLFWCHWYFGYLYVHNHDYLIDLEENKILSHRKKRCFIKIILKSYSKALWLPIFSTGPIQQPGLVKEHENDEDGKDVENDAVIVAPRPYQKCTHDRHGRRICFGKKWRGKKRWKKHERFIIW